MSSQPIARELGATAAVIAFVRSGVRWAPALDAL